MFGSGGINRNTIFGRRPADIARTVAQPTEMEPVETQLMVVVSSAAISAPNFRYSYIVKRAVVGNGPAYAPGLSANNVQETALSVSELSNAAGFPFVSYGVARANIPAGFAPQPIPNGTYVLCVPHRTADGSLIWLIVNTQAIDGVCT